LRRSALEKRPDDLPYAELEIGEEEIRLAVVGHRVKARTLRHVRFDLKKRGATGARSGKLHADNVHRLAHSRDAIDFHGVYLDRAGIVESLDDLPRVFGSLLAERADVAGPRFPQPAQCFPMIFLRDEILSGLVAGQTTSEFGVRGKEDEHGCESDGGQGDGGENPISIFHEVRELALRMRICSTVRRSSAVAVRQLSKSTVCVNTFRDRRAAHNTRTLARSMPFVA